MLFQALSILPHLSEISYIGEDGLFFSYYIDGNKTFAVYSNSSLVFNSSTTPKVTSNYSWYTQPVSRDTGRLFGEAIPSFPITIANSSWFVEALNGSDGSASLGHRWNSDRELVFLNSASMDGKQGLVSLGFSVKSLSKFFLDIDFIGGNLYLASKDGHLFLQGIPNTHMVVVDGDSVSLQLLKPNGVLVDHIGNISCKPNNDGKTNSTIMDVLGTKYIVQCSRLNILGVQSVCYLSNNSFPQITDLYCLLKASSILDVIYVLVLYENCIHVPIFI